jgi:hypothetical protein
MPVVKLHFCKWCEKWVKGICREIGKPTNGSEDHSGGCMKGG